MAEREGLLGAARLALRATRARRPKSPSAILSNPLFPYLGFESPLHCRYGLLIQAPQQFT